MTVTLVGLTCLALNACGSASPVPADSPSASTTKPSAKPADSADQLGLRGVLFFHSYSDYSAWDSNLYGLDLATGRLEQINTGWKTMISPMNLHLNKAGDAMVFMGSPSGLAEPEWDVFVSRWNGKSWAEPTNLTGPNGMRDEDPKFSPDGSMVAYKNNGVLATMKSDGSHKELLTLGAAESSIPYFTADGKGIIFDREGSVWLRLNNGEEKVLWQGGETKAYYAVGVDEERFLFTEVQVSRHDRTMWGYYDGRPAKPLFYADESCDNSDPFPYQNGARFVFYVTGCPFIYKGGYNLAVADQLTKKSYNIDDINPDANSNIQELGPTWSPNAKVAS